MVAWPAMRDHSGETQGTRTQTWRGTSASKSRAYDAPAPGHRAVAEPAAGHRRRRWRGCRTRLSRAACNVSPMTEQRTHSAGDSSATEAGGPGSTTSASIFSSAESTDVTAVEAELAIDPRREMDTLTSDSAPSDAGELASDAAESSARDETGEGGRTGSIVGRRGAAAMARVLRCLAAMTLAASTDLPDRSTPTSRPRADNSALSANPRAARAHHTACWRAAQARAGCRG